MASITSSRSTTKVSRAVAIYAAIAAGIALLALAGWISGQHILAGEWGIYVPMAPITALLFLLLSSALFIFANKPALRFNKPFVLTAAGIVFLLGLLVLVQFIFGIDLGIEIFLSGTNEWLGSIPLGRMSPLTAISFLLGSTALLFLTAERWRNVPTVAWLPMALLNAGAPKYIGGLS